MRQRSHLIYKPLYSVSTAPRLQIYKSSTSFQLEETKMTSNLIAICPIETFQQETKLSSKQVNAPLTPPSSFDIYTPKWLAGRDEKMYPTDPELPWHFSWIDQHVAGSSAPASRYHWNAMKNANVGLVVNLTETAIAPSRFKQPCYSCDFQEESYESDLFADLAYDDDVKSMFIPVSDGNIPRWEQLSVFLEATRNTIKSGKKIVVHCQAGGIINLTLVGRTGIFLAVYLMEIYNLSSVEALDKLRYVRPQSLQFDRIDWQSEPFKFSDPRNYQRNYVQERFLEMYHEKIRGHAINNVELEMGRHISMLIDKEIQKKFDFFERNPVGAVKAGERVGDCAVCRGVLSVGPTLVFNAEATLSPMSMHSTY